MNPPPLIAIFGAAVLPSGRPSMSLLRRIGYGYAAACEHPHAKVLCSGGVGRAGPSEASIMAEVLGRRGLPSERLILDEASLDTLQSVVVAARLSREAGGVQVVTCSDGYHLPRIRLMLAALGVPTARGPAPRGPNGASIGYWLKMSLREAPAIPYDLALILAQRRRFTS